MSQDFKEIAGMFHIVETDQWDEDFANLAGQAYVEVEPDGTGRFQFCAVSGVMDCRLTERDGEPAIEFSWEGGDEDTPVCGRGWMTLGNDPIKGHIFIHMADDSGFVAKRVK